MDISLALGGGGVKGYAHVGVIRALERHGFRIRAIGGTSAGAMMGAVYGAGYNTVEIEERLMLMDQTKLYFRLPGDGPSLLGLGGAAMILEEFLGDADFADMRLPLAVTAVNLGTGREVILNTGKVLDSVLASIALPGIFPPRMIDGQLYVDGGVLDPVPVSVARMLAPGLPVVAVVLSPEASKWSERGQAPGLLNSLPLFNRLSQFRLAQSLSIFLRSVDVAGCLLTDLRLQLEQPEVVIRPDVPPLGIVDHVDIAELIRQGDMATEKAMPQLLEAVSWRRQVIQRLPWLSPWLVNGKANSKVKQKVNSSE